MNINFDPDNLRACMRLWRDSLSNAMPMATEFQLHFIQERPTILRNFSQTASAWLMAFRGASPAPDDQEVFASLIADIEEFEAWTKAELGALDTLALQAALEVGMDELMSSHPDVVANLSRYFKKNPGSEAG